MMTKDEHAKAYYDLNKNNDRLNDLEETNRKLRYEI